MQAECACKKRKHRIGGSLPQVMPKGYSRQNRAGNLKLRHCEPNTRASHQRGFFMPGDCQLTLEERITRHEGREEYPYVDTVGKITIGVGHNLTDNGLPDHIIDLLLDWDIDIARRELDRIHPKWRQYTPNRKDCLVELVFNMGAPNLLTFKKMWAAIEAEDWAEAAAQLLDSRWASQVGATRASNLADLLEDG